MVGLCLPSLTRTKAKEDLNGEELWKSTFEEIKGPRNICTDETGNIFVAATESNAVYVISADGSKFMKLLGQDDGMMEPKAMYFNQQNSELIVANKRGGDFTDHCVYCLDLDGEEIWRAKFDEIKGPRNICTDPFGNVFLAAADSDAVFALSPDGKKCKKLLNAEDGMKEPKALYFNNKILSCLWQTNAEAYLSAVLSITAKRKNIMFNFLVLLNMLNNDIKLFTFLKRTKVPLLNKGDYRFC
ncbi:unnamed protein product [Mytilus edulis]|uniref:Uncharacterized protein n=1 Tax=Mytilus edulis TaxID=6550 RepID=A0A8S3TX56_MYTED|nr:unnamed protein product [Mytilus edulis]